MTNNNLLETLNPAGSMGLGERGKPKSRPKAEIASTSLAEPSLKNPRKQGEKKRAAIAPPANYYYQEKNIDGPKSKFENQKNRRRSEANANPFIGIVILCSIVGLLGGGVLIGSNINASSGHGNSSSYSGNKAGPIPYGKARFKSGRTGKSELIRVRLSSRSNSNGHTTYDAQWGDGYKSSYVFWANGRAEIFSKNGNGDIERTNAVYKKMSNGDCVITADTNAVTTFPDFTPVAN